jgi:hypothetical protein
MPQLQMSVPHQLSRAEAMRRIKGLLESLKAENLGRISDLREEWTETGGTFSFSAMGFPVSGLIEVGPADIQLSGDLPLAATFFKSKIESVIRERAAELLA